MKQTYILGLDAAKHKMRAALSSAGAESLCSLKKGLRALPFARAKPKGGAGREFLALTLGSEPSTLTARMRRKIDQPEARRIYARRLTIVEPVFANLRRNKRLDHFTYRGRVKVNIQWLLYCLVHNPRKDRPLRSELSPQRQAEALVEGLG